MNPHAHCEWISCELVCNAIWSGIKIWNFLILGFPKNSEKWFFHVNYSSLFVFESSVSFSCVSWKIMQFSIISNFFCQDFWSFFSSFFFIIFITMFKPKCEAFTLAIILQICLKNKAIWRVSVGRMAFSTMYKS